MEFTNVFLLTIVALLLSFEVLNAEENKPDAKETKPPFNPLEDLILNQNKNGVRKQPLSRVKRQYGPYYGRRYPYPVPIIVGGFGGFGGYGGGFGRGFGGRGFGGRGGGFGGRGIGGGFGGGRGGRG